MLTQLSAAELGRKVAAREVSATEVAEAFLDKAEADQQAGRVGSLGPLYDTGINVGRATIRGLLGVK